MGNIRVMSADELKAHETAIDESTSLGDIVDAIYGDDLRRAYVMDNHSSVIFYHYINGFWRGEFFENIADAYASAREYGGAAEDEPEAQEPEAEDEPEETADYSHYPSHLLSAADVSAAEAAEDEPRFTDDSVKVFFVYWLDSHGFAELMAVMPEVKASQSDANLVSCFVEVGGFTSVYLSEARAMPLADVDSAEVKALARILSNALCDVMTIITPK